MRRGFYLVLYTIALRTLLLSLLDIETVIKGKKLLLICTYSVKGKKTQPMARYIIDTLSIY